LLLVNNVFLTVMAITVLLGTLYPLLIDALGQGKISVGPPYFNAVFVPIMCTMALAMGVSIAVRWRETTLQSVLNKLWKPAVLSILIGLGFPFIYGNGFDARVFLGISVGLWIISTVGTEFIGKFRNTQSITNRLRQLPLSYYGMMVAHVGVAVTAIGITLVTSYSEERDMSMHKGDTVEIAGYQFTFQGTHVVKGANYMADQATIEVVEDGQPVATLRPEKRRYNVKNAMMTEADIDASLFRDLYVALGEPLEQGAWAVRMHYKPYVRWLWLGGILMALGGLLTVADKRYRQSSPNQEATHA
ncbi:MAG: cytochrome c-type biogenesis CcmF C-terminal domain-containing protein, partial [Methyloprofundus sp.]